VKRHNSLELAVAAAISLFGFESGAAFATVVGVLIEVPVVLLVVGVANATKRCYDSGLSESAMIERSMAAWVE
jgi:ACR3 family arsenite transporter